MLCAIRISRSILDIRTDGRDHRARLVFLVSCILIFGLSFVLVLPFHAMVVRLRAITMCVSRVRVAVLALRAIVDARVAIVRVVFRARVGIRRDPTVISCTRVRRATIARHTTCVVVCDCVSSCCYVAPRGYPCVCCRVIRVRRAHIVLMCVLVRRIVRIVRIVIVLFLVPPFLSVLLFVFVLVCVVVLFFSVLYVCCRVSFLCVCHSCSCDSCCSSLSSCCMVRIGRRDPRIRISGRVDTIAIVCPLALRHIRVIRLCSCAVVSVVCLRCVYVVVLRIVLCVARRARIVRRARINIVPLAIIVMLERVRLARRVIRTRLADAWSSCSSSYS